MKKYFTEFEFHFENNQGIMFWFPVLINANTEDEAVKMYKEIQTVLGRLFIIPNEYGLVEYTKPIHSSALKPYVEVKRRAEILKLNLNDLQFANFGEDIGLTFNQHIVIVPQNLLMEYRHTIQFHLDKLNFLTTQFNGNLDFNKDFLVLKIC